MRKRNPTTFLCFVLVLTIFAFSLVATVQAVTVQEITGKLGGADYLLRIPSNWNGKLVVFCHGYSHLEPTPAYLVSQANGMAGVVNMGFALALSTYGAGGGCVKEGIIRTHQMTQYIMDNYGITDSVYLIGISMGGNIVLQLGEKYPELYDGVLDISGSKNLITQYNDKMYFAGISDNTALRAAILSKYGVSVPLVFMNSFRSFCLESGTDIGLACGGTPEEKPKSYERLSPTFSAEDITVPTMTVHGTADILVPYSSAIEYMNAIDAAGHLNMYRLYKVVDGLHADPAVMNQSIGVRFPQLVNWVENGVLPPSSIP